MSKPKIQRNQEMIVDVVTMIDQNHYSLWNQLMIFDEKKKKYGSKEENEDTNKSIDNCQLNVEEGRL